MCAWMAQDALRCIFNQGGWSHGACMHDAVATCGVQIRYILGGATT